MRAERIVTPSNSPKGGEQELLKLNNCYILTETSTQNIFKQIEMLELGRDLQNMAKSQRDSVYELALQWKEVVDMIAEANRLAIDEKANPSEKKPVRRTGESDESWQSRITQWKEKRDAEIQQIEKRKKERIEAARKRADRAILRKKKFTGGMIIGDGTRDSIPTMTAPGEFVMRKAAVDKYGPAMFNSMNMGSFSMPKYEVPQITAPQISNVGNSTSIMAPVYNTYSINVPVTQPNATADEIAQKVITKIRNVDSMAVRSFRGY